MDKLTEVKAGGVGAADARSEPLAAEEQRVMWTQNEGWVHGIVALGLGDLFGGFEPFLDRLSTALVGHDCLMEVDYTLRGFEGGTLFFEVRGQLMDEPGSED